MKCPKCGTLLNEVTKAGVLIDVCDHPPEREPAWRDDDER